MGNSPSKSPPSPSSKSSSASASAPTPDGSNGAPHGFPIPETQEDDIKKETLQEAYQRGLADGYRQAIDTEQLQYPPECKNPDVKYQWITYGWDREEHFPVEAWKSKATQEGVTVWGPCPGCGAMRVR